MQTYQLINSELNNSWSRPPPFDCVPEKLIQLNFVWSAMNSIKRCGQHSVWPTILFSYPRIRCVHFSINCFEFPQPWVLRILFCRVTSMSLNAMLNRKQRWEHIHFVLLKVEINSFVLSLNALNVACARSVEIIYIIQSMCEPQKSQLFPFVSTCLVSAIPSE